MLTPPGRGRTPAPAQQGGWNPLAETDMSSSRILMLPGLTLCLLLAGPLTRPLVAAPARPPANADLEGTVRDSANGGPLPGAEVVVSSGSRIAADVVTDQFGRFVVHDLAPGSYRVAVHLIGFATAARTVAVGESAAPVQLDLRLVAQAVSLSALEVTARAPIAVDTRTGNQVYQQNQYHGAPTSTTSQILQQSIVGAARAPTGEVHIRGQHAEYTYYVDGVPVPPGISGSLNELFDPEVVNRIEFQTGGWDAEYGGRNAAIVQVQTQIPAGGFHVQGSTYGGSYNSDGQTLNLSSNEGRWGWFVSGTRQETNMREEPVVFDTASLEPVNFHNHGQDLFTFGKLRYVPTPADEMDLDLNWSRTAFAVPFDSTQGLLNDHQRDVNSFANLSWRHRFSRAGAGGEGEAGSDLFAAFFYRHGSLDYMPGTTDEPSFIFYPDTVLYNISENRGFNVYGVKADYRWSPSHAAEFKVGTQSSATSGREDFVTTDAAGNPGPASRSGLNGHDLGFYGETMLTPVEWLQLRAGIRYDSHAAPFTTTQHQVSPRLRLNFFPDPANTLYLYYGRLFMPTNIEDLRAITTVSEGGDTTATAPTLPERDDFFSGGVIHRFPSGIVAKLSAYLKNSSPGIDDNTVPGTSIVTDVNLAVVHIRGIEAAIEVRPSGPLSGYLNFAINHAYGHGPVTGGFFPTDIADVPGGWFDLDHDQRVSSVASAVYSAHRSFLSATGIYGSGLTNGADIGAPIGRGLFDFNPDIHVDPSFVMDAAAGHSFIVGAGVLTAQLYVNNVFDKHYLLKGAFFSGASVGRPRAVQLKLSVGY